MQEKTLKEKEYIDIDGKTYFISAIPAWKAERLMLKGLTALSAMDISKLPDDFLWELLSYCGIKNEATNTEIQFVNEQVLDGYVIDPMVLIELQARMVEKNFGFFSDGRLTRVMTRLGEVFNPKPEDSSRT